VTECSNLLAATDASQILHSVGCIFRAPPARNPLQLGIFLHFTESRKQEIKKEAKNLLSRTPSMISAASSYTVNKGFSDAKPWGGAQNDGQLT
jgi:hypothetical protein